MTNLEGYDDALAGMKGLDGCLARSIMPMNSWSRMSPFLGGGSRRGTSEDPNLRGSEKANHFRDVFCLPQMVVPVTLTITSCGCVMSGMGESIGFTSFFPNYVRAFTDFEVRGNLRRDETQFLCIPPYGQFLQIEPQLKRTD